MTELISLWPKLHAWQRAEVALKVRYYAQKNCLLNRIEDAKIDALDWFYMHFVRSIIMRNDEQLIPPQYPSEELMQYAALFFPEQPVQKHMS